MGAGTLRIHMAHSLGLAGLVLCTQKVGTLAGQESIQVGIQAGKMDTQTGKIGTQAGKMGIQAERVGTQVGETRMVVEPMIPSPVNQ